MRMRSRSRMARARRSMAAGISRRVSGSCRSSKMGRRKWRAASGSANPRCTNTLAAGGAMRRAAESAATTAGSGAGMSQRVPLVFGEKPAKGIALVEILFGQAGGDLVFHGQVFLVPIGLHFVHVQPGIVVEGQFDGAGLPFVAAQVAEAALVIALLIAIHRHLVQLFEQVGDVLGSELASAEENQADAHFRGGVQEHLVVGVILRVPEHHLAPIERARRAAEDSELPRFEVSQNFALECIEIQVQGYPTRRPPEYHSYRRGRVR